MDRPLKSVTHGQCDARPAVTFPAAGHHRPLTGTKLYCLVTEARACEQLAQGCYLKVERPGIEPATFCVASQHANQAVIQFNSIKYPDENAEAKPSSNLLQRTGGDHRGTTWMTCLRWILGYMRLEIWCKIGLWHNKRNNNNPDLYSHQ